MFILLLIFFMFPKAVSHFLSPRTLFCWIYISMVVMIRLLWPHGMSPARLLCPWDFPGKNSGVGCHFLFQGIFLTQGSNLPLLHCRQSLALYVDSTAEPLCLYRYKQMFIPSFGHATTVIIMKNRIKADLEQGWRLLQNDFGLRLSWIP